MKSQFLKLAGIMPAVIAASLCFSSCKKDAASATPPTTETRDLKASSKATYTQIWSDEFNGSSVNTSNWNFETGTGQNNEKEYYQASNATEGGGNLIITAKKQAVGGMQYTSARLNTQNKFSVQYGRIEARIKLPNVAGMWPAFWMLGNSISSIGWPKCGEIDIMEQANTNNTIYGTIHWADVNGNHVQYGLTTTTTLSDYHVYAVEWDKTGIRWYVDNTLYCTANTTNNVNNTGAFNAGNFFIILNLAVGGDFTGGTAINDAGLPTQMLVDYVRVYKIS